MSQRRNGPRHGLVLGIAEKEKAKGFPAPIWDEGPDGHLVTVAPTGAGKGVSCIIPALLTWQGPAIVIDPKGENYAVTAARRRAMGQKVHVLDPFGITGCVQPASLNPFDIVGKPRTARWEDFVTLARAVVQDKTFGKNQDPYWDNRAANLIACAMAHASAHLPAPTLEDVLTLVLSYDQFAMDFRHQPFETQCHPEIAAPFAPAGMAWDKTRIAITSTAVDLISYLMGGSVLTSLKRSTVDLRKVERGDPMTLYLVLPPDKLATHGKLLRLWMTCLMTVLTRRRTPPAQPTLLLVDEAAQLGEMRELVTAVTLMRGYGIRVWTFWQDLSQLKATYPDHWEAILNNCAYHQYFGAATPMAANALQAYLGDALLRSVHRMKANELALFRPRERGAIVRMPSYLTDPMYQGLYEPNPFYEARQPKLPWEEPGYALEESADGVVLAFPQREGRDA